MSNGKPLFSKGEKFGKYNIISDIYIGNNSVYKAFIEGEIKKYYAIKAYPYQEKEDIDLFNNELDLLDNFEGDDSVVHYIEIIQCEKLIQVEDENDGLIEKNITFVCVVMDFYDQLDLKAYFNEFRSLPRIETIRMVLAKALKILIAVHSKGIVHCDIKPNNFLVKCIDPLEISLSDFEFSTQLMNNESIKTDFLRGTPQYMAPEMLNYMHYRQPIDIWSLGIMIYKFAFNRFPFNIRNDDNIETITTKINKKIRISAIGRNPRPILEKQFYDLIKKMLDFDPDQRITAVDALHHEFFNGYVELEEDTAQVKDDLTSVQTEQANTEKYKEGHENV